jgi:hypothetical protein
VLVAKPIPGAEQLIEIVGRHELVQIERCAGLGEARRQFPGNGGPAFELRILCLGSERQCGRKGKNGGAYDASLSKKSPPDPHLWLLGNPVSTRCSTENCQPAYRDVCSAPEGNA